MLRIVGFKCFWARVTGPMNALRYIGSLGLLVLALGTSLAMAQQETAVPKTPAPPKAAAPAAPARAAQAPADAGQGEEDWVKLCTKSEQTGNKEICLVTQDRLDPDTGLVLVSAAVQTVEGDDKQQLLIRLATARSLVMPAGAQIKIDDSEPMALQYAVCIPTSCEAKVELTKEMFESMRKGKQMIVAALNTQKTMAISVPLTSFSKAYDGAPVDNATYEEAKRQMMEQFRQRIDANKAAEHRGTQQPQAGAPPRAGAEVPIQAPAH
jgi:invasion protein IalB